MNDDPEKGVVVRYHADTKELHVLVDRTLAGVPWSPAVRVQWDSNGLRIIIEHIGKDAIEGQGIDAVLPSGTSTGHAAS